MKNFTHSESQKSVIGSTLLALIMAFFAISPQLVTAQCTWSTVTYGTGTAPSIGNNVNITTCAYAGERSTINSVDSNNTYIISYSNSATAIITVFNSSQTAVAWGPSPLAFVAPANGTFYSQGNTTGCGTNTSCNTVNWANLGVISCPQPSFLTATSITSSSASLGWTENGTASLWEVEYGFSGFTMGTGMADTTSSNPLAVTGLSAGSVYDFYVRAVCGVGDSSFWSGPFTFNTPCLSTLSGVYTVDPSLPASATNFTSLATMVNALNLCGISGAVTINVAANSGPYAEAMDFTAISGASATNTVTINGNGNVVNVASGQNHFVRMDGAKHITINDFQFVNQDPSSPMFGIQFTNAADSNAVTNNLIDVGTDYTSSLSAGIAVSGSVTSATTSGDNGNYLTITGNEIIGGYYGISTYGTSTSAYSQGFVISNNNVHDFYLYGIRTYYSNDVVVEGNDVSRSNRTTLSTFYGIYNYYTTYTRVIGNKIHGDGVSTSTAYPVYFGNSSNLAGFESEYINNAIYDIQTTGTIYGMYFLGTRDSVNVYHNTIDLTSGGTSTHRGIYISGAPNNHVFLNNLINVVGSNTSTNYGIYVATTSTSFTSDYNDVYVATAGTNHYGYWSGNRTTLADWQTATSQAANSVEGNPVITSATDFTPLSNLIDNLGSPIGITTDIDGASRSLTTPDFGAREFTGLSGDLALTATNLARVSVCYGSSDSAFATISNILGTAVDFSVDPLTVVWNVTGPVATTDTLVVSSGTLGSGLDTTVSIATIDMSLVGSYSVSAYILPNAVNGSAANDSIWNGGSAEVIPILVASPDTAYVTSGFDSVKLSTTSPLYPPGAFFFTELCQFAGSSTGIPVGGNPSWMNSDDYVEITGVPGSDLSGVTLEIWTSTILRLSYTFPSGTVLSPNGTAVIGTQSGTDSPANYFYVTNPTYSNSSGTASGYILRNSSGAILDAVGYSTYSFPAATGVTTADWTGTNVSGSSSWGIRLEGPDLNDNTGWIKSTQDPGVVNNLVTVPSPPSVAGITWDSLGTTVGTDPVYWGGPYNVDGIHPYVVTYTNVCGTFADTAVVVVTLTNAAITASTDVLCFGDSTGTATVTPGGGDAPYTYLWSNGDVNATAVGLPAGTYTVTVFDANMWPATASVTISEPSTAVSGTTSSTPTTCGVPSGSASIVASGGVSPYTYLWSDGATTATNTGIFGGTYDVTVTDANGCTLVESVVVLDIGAPVLTVVVDSVVTCYGGSDGVATVTAVGGTSPYTYAWSTGETTATAEALPFGLNSVTITDATGCSISTTMNMGTNPQLLAVISSSTDPLCYGDATGTATSVGGGGIAPYTYAWSNGDTTSNASALAAGMHTVSVTDAVGCVQTATVNIVQPNQLAGTFVNVMNVNCNGASDGSAGIVVAGGTGPYTYAWSNGGGSSAVSGLAAGVATVTVTDANSCELIESVTISEPAALVATLGTVTDVNCFGGNDGSASVSVTGGTAPYVYTWSNGAGGSIATGLSANTYTVTVTDANNCTTVETAVVNGPASAVLVSMSNTNVSCNGNGDGSATAAATGGSGVFTYSWSTGSTGASISGLAPGYYSVTATDANGCSAVGFVTITQPAMLMVTTSSMDATCNGDSDASAMAMVTGGASPYTYSWSNGANTDVNNNITAGSYDVTVTDANGCSVIASVMVSEPMPVMVDLGEDQTICSSDVLTLDAGTYASYLWNDGSNAQTRVIDAAVVGTGAATYSVEVTNAAGCMGGDTVVITVAPEVTTTIIGAKDMCNYETITLDAGPGFSSYTWSNTSNSQLINVYASALTPGVQVYSVTVTDENGCSGVAMDSLTVHPEVIVDLGPDTIVWQNAVYIIDADTGFASYSWNTGATSQSISVSSAGTYAVTVTDKATGCRGTDEVIVDFALSVNSLASAQLRLYPNPAVDFINLEFSNFVNQGSVEIKIMSVTGQLVKTQMIDVNATNGKTQIDVSHLAVGSYVVSFEYNGENVVKQFVIRN